MYLHIGGDFAVRASDIIAIIDVKNLESSTKNFDFFEQVRLSGNLINTNDKNDCKSYVVTDTYVYFSPISTSTLKKRLKVSLS